MVEIWAMNYVVFEVTSCSHLLFTDILEGPTASKFVFKIRCEIDDFTPRRQIW